VCWWLTISCPPRQKKLSKPSDRVKCVDIHPTEPWVLAALYTGHVHIWNYDTNTQVKSIEVGELPVRAAKFIARKQWIVTGSDEMDIRCFNYNTTERVTSFNAHTDYIRALEVHPTLPYVLSCSDDLQIRMWNWERNWECVKVFEGHAHYVMMAKFNPKDTNTFATASLDRSVKVWGLSSNIPNFSLEGHEAGVNCVGYYPAGDKPYLISGADDSTVKVWDYQTKACVATLPGHTNNVVAACFHPKLPIILSGAEDGTVRIWHSTTYGCFVWLVCVCVFVSLCVCARARAREFVCCEFHPRVSMGGTLYSYRGVLCAASLPAGTAWRPH